MTQLYLIRHGEVEERYHNVFGGCRVDMGLSPLGLRQGHAVAEALREVTLDHIFSSPMQRVRQTMQPSLELRGREAAMIEDLREIDFGEWTGHRWEEVEQHFGISAYDWLKVLDSPEGIRDGESGAQLRGRLEPALASILEASAGGTAAVFCHGGIIRALLGLLLEVPLPKTSHFSIDYGSITHVTLNPKKQHRVEIELLNWRPPLVH